MKYKTNYRGVLFMTVFCLVVLTTDSVHVSNAQTPAPQRYRAVPMEVRQRLIEGYEATFAGDYQAADEAFADVQQLAPEWVEGYRGQAESLKWRSKPEAEDAFLKALAYGADDAALLLDLAIYAEGRKDTERALEFYREALEANRYHYPTLLQYGTALYRAGQYAEARNILLQAIKVNPEDSGGIQMLAAVLIDDSAADPGERDFYSSLNEASKATFEGRYEDAMDIFERIFVRYQPSIELPAVYRATEQHADQRFESPYLPLDLVLIRAGYLWFFYLQDIDGGLFFWEFALEINPDNPWAMINTARALYARNEHALDESNAFQLIDSAIKLDRRNPLINAVAGEIYLTHYGPDTILPVQTFGEYNRSKRNRIVIWPLSDTGVTILPFITAGWAYQVALPGRATGNYRVMIEPTFETIVDPAVTVTSHVSAVDQVVEDTNRSASPTIFVSNTGRVSTLHITIADHAVGALKLSVDVQDEDGKWIPFIPSTARATTTAEIVATATPRSRPLARTAVPNATSTAPMVSITATPTATPLSGNQHDARELIIDSYDKLFQLMNTGEGDINEVVADLNEAVRLAPDWWIPYWAFAEFYTLAEEFELAQDAADTALGMGGDFEARGRLHYLRMNAVSRSGSDNFAAIATDARIYIERQPYSTSGYHFLGYAQLHLGELEDAETTLRHGLMLEPGHRSLIFNLVNTLDAMAPNLAPRNDYQMWSELNQAFRSEQNKALWFGGAVIAAQNFDGDPAYVYVAQAQHLLFELGNLPDGLAAAMAAVEMSPDWAIAQQTIGRGLTTDNDFEAAIPYFDRAFELDPTLFELHRFRLRAYGYIQREVPPAETALYFSLTSRHAIPWELDPSGTTILPYIDLGAYEMPFEALEGQDVYIRARSAFNSISNPVLLIVGPDGTPLASAHNNSGNPSRQIAELEFSVPETGTYTLMVGDVHPRTAAEVEFEIVP